MRGSSRCRRRPCSALSPSPPSWPSLLGLLQEWRPGLCPREAPGSWGDQPHQHSSHSRAQAEVRARLEGGNQQKSPRGKVSSCRVGAGVENEPIKDGGGEGKLSLVGSGKTGVESKSGKRKQTWKPVAERVGLKVLDMRQGEEGATEDFRAREWLGQINTVGKNRGLGRLLQLVKGNSPWLG